MKMTLTLFAFSVLSSCAAQKKIDYLKIREDVRAPLCGIRDSVSTRETYANLLAVDSSSLKKNKDMYYGDLAEMERLLYMYHGNVGMLRSEIDHSMAEISYNPKAYDAMWGLAFAFHLFGECARMEDYLKMYDAAVPKKSRHSNEAERIALLRERCGENRVRIHGAEN
jgi:hypothetical protein